MKMHNTIRAGVLTISAALMLAPMACAPLDDGATVIDRGQHLRAWQLPNSARAEALTAKHQLVGLGCGRERLTMTAEMEDHFPIEGCDTIDTPEALCGYDEGDLPLAYECARYMGDGW